MRLQVLSKYDNSQGTVYMPGNILTVSDSVGVFLQSDAPGCFRVLPESFAPPSDGMIHGAVTAGVVSPAAPTDAEVHQAGVVLHTHKVAAHTSDKKPRK